jgi:hypothetical protein
MLTEHDWQYEYADDFRVWNCGSDNRKKIVKISMESDRHLALYNEFMDYTAGITSKRPTCPDEDPI